jgi:hypothetical protein
MGDRTLEGRIDCDGRTATVGAIVQTALGRLAGGLFWYGNPPVTPRNIRNSAYSALLGVRYSCFSLDSRPQEDKPPEHCLLSLSFIIIATA